LGEKLEVHRNDQITLDQIAGKKPQRIVISPGPGTPEESGICVDVIRASPALFPSSEYASAIRRSAMRLEGASFARRNHARQNQPHPPRQQDVFKICAGFAATRYHSLIVEEKNASERSRNFSENRWHHHGPAPPQTPHRRRAVSPESFSPM